MMKLFLLLLLVACFAVSVLSIHEAPVQKLVCEKELNDICGMEFPVTPSSIFQGRLCLWANFAYVSKDCTTYIEVINPSIVEQCYDIVQRHCKAVEPGDNRIHNCVLEREKQGDKLSPKCKEVLHSDLDFSSSTETNIEEESIAILSGEDAQYDDAYDEMYEEELQEAETEMLLSAIKVLKELEGFEVDVIKLANKQSEFVVSNLIAHISSEMSMLKSWMKTIVGLAEDDTFNTDEFTVSSDSIGDDVYAVEEISEEEYIESKEIPSEPTNLRRRTN